MIHATTTKADLIAEVSRVVEVTRRNAEVVVETILARIESPQLEIAHVLFMDLVGYSPLPMDEATARVKILQELVRQTPAFQAAKKAEALIALPTGDGMALAFFVNPISAVRCAMELSRVLRNHPELELRMGVHSGPVHRLEDINEAHNVAGGGINTAQRVMDCGDAGHILLSESVADILRQVGGWEGDTDDLGEFTVKHGENLHLFNLHGDDFGNPELPHRSKQLEKKEVTETESRFQSFVERYRETTDYVERRAVDEQLRSEEIRPDLDHLRQLSEASLTDQELQMAVAVSLSIVLPSEGPDDKETAASILCNLVESPFERVRLRATLSSHKRVLLRALSYNGTVALFNIARKAIPNERSHAVRSALDSLQNRLTNMYGSPSSSEIDSPFGKESPFG